MSYNELFILKLSSFFFNFHFYLSLKNCDFLKKYPKRKIIFSHNCYGNTKKNSNIKNFPIP